MQQPLLDIRETLKPFSFAKLFGSPHFPVTLLLTFSVLA